MIGMTPTRSAVIELPNARAAQAFQNSQIGQNLGPYDLVSRSCQTHVREVLGAGGADVPTGALRFDGFLRGIGAHPRPR
jgi:hypothetical protein